MSDHTPQTTLSVPQLPSQVIVIKQQVSMMITHAVGRAIERIRPTTAEEVEAAREALVELQKIKTKLDSERKQVAKPFRDVVDQINDVARPWIDLVDEVQQKLKNGIAEFLQKQEQERQARLREAEQNPEKALVVGGLDSPAVSTYEYTEIEVVDEAAVPREYCSPDMAKLRAAVNAGATEIPGVRIQKVRRIAAR